MFLSSSLKILLTIVPIVIGSFGYGQKQNNIWYFGNEAGLDFKTNPPTAIQSNLTTLEGTASVCDPLGNLLFYTNGETVWDRGHNVMPNGNGLLGGESSAQAALIVPQPNSCTQYYLFTTEDHYTNGGMHYSIVDICLNNGFGDIIASSKNTLVVDRSAEKITAVLHSNGIDIWIITHRLNSREFLAYLLTSTGLNTTPVVSSIGAFYASNAHIGPVKASHDGTKIVSSSTFHDICDMFDFNATTGALTNYYDINQLFNSQRTVYGIEFSPNDDLLYLSTTFITNYLYQIDLGTKQLRTLNSIGGNYHYGALQLGPDKKIYMARNNSDFLDIIHQPDIAGNGCQYDEEGIQLVAGTYSLLGLPNFTPYSFLTENQHTITLGKDTILCMGASIELSYALPGNCEASYLWNDGSTGQNNIITQSGLYWVEAQNGCIIYRDTIEVGFISPPGALINAQICLGESYEGYDESGIFTDTFSLSSGCDSVRTLNLTVESEEEYLNITLCAGEKFEQYTQPGVYIDTLTGLIGVCDTVRYLNLTVISSLETHINATICEGQTFLGYSVSGIYSDTFTAISGCDSIRILNLMASNEIFTAEYIKICLGDSYEGHFLAGIYIDTFQSFFGCDSIHQLDLEIIPVENYVEVDICLGEKFEAYNMAGIYTDTLQGITSSCDTIRHLSLNVIQPLKTTIETSICNGESYFGHDTAGNYIDTLQSQSGCDSIRNLVLTVQDQVTSTISDDLCNANLYGYSHAGIYIDTLISSLGCDSIRTLYLEGSSLYIPNVFSPNNDGVNDIFTVFESSSNSLDLQYFALYDRFGDLAYETENWPIIWYGDTLDGENFQNGVFAYILIYICNEKPIIKYGNVTVIR